MDQGTKVARNHDDQKFDVYKLRAGEFRDRYERMRDTAWKVLFETYVAYGLIAAAFFKVSDKFFHSTIAGVASGATILFFAVNLFLWKRINERLRFFNEMYEAYMEELHSLAQAPKLPTKRLKFEFRWAYWPQILLNTITMLCLVAYIWFTKAN
ncbi:MAG TPA: hypothetical protein VKY85_19300 [Candidatus Angelobacter sp.]|nr:hypothetical protein [Candidatus Angelobacter sp.]